MFRLKGRGRRFGLAVVTGLVIAYFIAPLVIRHLIRSRLQSMIATELNAELQIGSLTYAYPYAVDVTDAALVAPGPDGKPLELLRVPHLALKLARSPLRSGPLVIESLLIQDPAIHLIKLKDGLVGRRGLIVSPDVPGAPKAKAKNWKLSDMFQLRRLTLHGGKAIYEDRSLAGTVPLVWNDLNVDLDTVPLSGSEYSFHFVADNAPLASIDALGSADIDSLLLRLSRCSLSVSVDPRREHSALPPEYQRIVRDLGVRGALVINTIATLPLTDLRGSKFDTTLELRDASATIPQLPDPIERLAAKLRVRDGAGRPALNVASLDATSGGVAVRLTGGSVTLDPNTLAWNLSALSGRVDAASIPGGRLSGGLDFTVSGSAPLFATQARQFRGELKLTPTELRTVPHVFPLPIDQFAEATLTLADGKLSARQLRAAYGNDVWFVKSAELDLNELPKLITLTDAEGCLTFGAPRSRYPAAVEKVLADVSPAGPWFFNAGNVRVPLADPQKTDYHAVVHTTRGRLALNDGRIPVYNINTVIDVTPRVIRVERFDAGALKGVVRASGWVQPDKGGRYAFDASAQGADMNELVRGLEKPGAKPTPLFGRANVVLRTAGVIPADSRPFLDALTGTGTFEVRNGDFWRIPVMKGIADDTNVREAMTVGDAAGIFDIANGAIHLHPAAVSAPLLGVEGSGDITFDGRLNLNLIATPLGKWGDKIDLGDNGVISGFVDTIQKGVNVATQQALYDVHVGGTPNHAIIDAIPAPFLTRQAVGLVNFMKGGSKDGGLLEFEKGRPSPQKAN